MNLLLDTHTLIWFGENDPLLSTAARKAIESKDNQCFVSIISYWEIAIKTSLGKLNLAFPLSEVIRKTEQAGINTLPVTTAHVLKVAQLPFVHRDPFDRLLIAQALTEQYSFVSNEALFDQYGVSRIW